MKNAVFRFLTGCPIFFLDHYDHPIFEGGKRLIDMIYLEMALSD